MLFQRLSLEIDNAARGATVLRYPCRHATTVVFGGVFARRRLRQVMVCDRLDHSRDHVGGSMWGRSSLALYSGVGGASGMQAAAKRGDVQYLPLVEERNAAPGNTSMTLGFTPLCSNDRA